MSRRYDNTSMLSVAVPFSNLNNATTFIAALVQRAEMTQYLRLEDDPLSIQMIINACLKYSKDERPEFTKIETMLSLLPDFHRPGTWNRRKEIPKDTAYGLSPS